MVISRFLNSVMEFLLFFSKQIFIFILQRIQLMFLTPLMVIFLGGYKPIPSCISLCLLYFNIWYLLILKSLKAKIRQILPGIWCLKKCCNLDEIVLFPVKCSHSQSSGSLVQRERDYYSKNQYWIFYHKLIETYFEILKSSEHQKLGRYSNYKSPNF